MMQILVVEDEPLIAQSIAALVEQHHAFQVAGVVTNGLDALERLRAEPVDAVLTDIRMPGMDGLELLRAIYTEFPGIHTVIISGYQVFSYAQTAIEYQAFDYLLKPITKDRIFSVLSRLEVACHIRRREQRRSKLQNSMKSGAKAGGEAEKRCTVLLMGAGALPHIATSLLAPGQVFWDTVDLDALLEDIVEGEFLLFGGKHPGERVLVLEGGDRPVDRSTVEQIYMAVRARAEELSITLVGHAVPVPMSQVGEVIGRLQVVLYNEMRLYQSLLIWRDCNRTEEVAGEELDPGLREKIIDSVCAGDEKSLKNALTRALTLIFDSNGTQQEVMRLLDAIVGDGRLSARMSTQDYSTLKYELSEAVVNNTDVGHLVEDLQTILVTAGPGPETEKRNAKEIMDDVEQFLQDNFDKQITHETLSRKFGFVPSYLSRKFREYKKMSPYEYLLLIRLSKARQLLTDYPDLLIRDVAKMVGYSDQYYFSKLFKKETGVWPSDFQKNIHGSNPPDPSGE